MLIDEPPSAPAPFRPTAHLLVTGLYDLHQQCTEQSGAEQPQEPNLICDRRRARFRSAVSVRRRHQHGRCEAGRTRDPLAAFAPFLGCGVACHKRCHPWGLPRSPVRIAPR